MNNISGISKTNQRSIKSGKTIAAVIIYAILTLLTLIIFALIVDVLVWLGHYNSYEFYNLGLCAGTLATSAALNGLFFVILISMLYKAIKINGYTNKQQKYQNSLKSLFISLTVLCIASFILQCIGQSALGTANGFDKSDECLTGTIFSVFTVILVIIDLVLYVLVGNDNNFKGTSQHNQTKNRYEEAKQKSDIELENEELEQELARLKNKKLKNDIAIEKNKQLKEEIRKLKGEK